MNNQQDETADAEAAIDETITEALHATAQTASWLEQSETKLITLANLAKQALQMKNAQLQEAAIQAADALETTLKRYARSRMETALIETELIAAMEKLRKITNPHREKAEPKARIRPGTANNRNVKQKPTPNK